MTSTMDAPTASAPLIQVGPNRMKQWNEPTRARLEGLMEKHNLTATEVARDIGKSLSALSKYLNQKPEGDVFSLEGLIEDYCANYEKRRDSKVTLFSTKVSGEVADALETIRKTNDLGLVTSPAGLGKSCGCQLYCAEFPTATMITVVRNLRSTPSGIIRALWAAGGSPNSRGKNHFEFLIEKFKGTNRLIVIDNAQLLSKSGLGFVFDFHDETGSPIALVGNPEIIKRISSNDQQFSRIGVHWKIEPPLDQMEVPTRKTIHQWFPEHVDELYRLARQVAVQMGHLRALKKQLRLAREIMTNQPDISPTTAFRSAHTMLIRNYKLKD